MLFCVKGQSPLFSKGQNRVFSLPFSAPIFSLLFSRRFPDDNLCYFFLIIPLICPVYKVSSTFPEISLNMKREEAYWKCKHFLPTSSLFIFARLVAYSNSIVAGGFPVQSYMTLLTCFTSFTILVVTLLRTSHGISAASAVIKSLVNTARSATA